MILIIPASTNNIKGAVSDNFGRANYFYVYNSKTQLGEFFENENKNGQGGVGIKAAEFVLTHKADVLIAPRMGEKSSSVLRGTDVHILEADPVSVEINITLALAGKLKDL